MDTDGYISSDGSMSFINTSKQLIDDFMEVLRSLGIICTVSKRAPGKGGIQNGREIFGTRFSYVVYIKGNPDVFYLPRKRSRIKINRKFSNKIAITNIKYLGEQERQRCILVDNPNHLYVTRDYIPTHNSFKGASMLVRNYELIPGSKNFAVASEQKFLIGDGLLTKAW
nr:MAG: Hom-end-associated Hint [Bacteriophage sp.]